MAAVADDKPGEVLVRRLVQGVQLPRLVSRHPATCQAHLHGRAEKVAQTFKQAMMKTTVHVWNKNKGFLWMFVSVFQYYGNGSLEECHRNVLVHHAVVICQTASPASRAC